MLRAPGLSPADAGSDEFYAGGRARPVGDAATRGSVLAAAKPMADASELLVERVMHTRWEESLTAHALDPPHLAQQPPPRGA